MTDPREHEIIGNPWEKDMTDSYQDDATWKGDVASEDVSYIRPTQPTYLHDHDGVRRVPEDEDRLRTPREWEQITGIRILDPDGWRFPICSSVSPMEDLPARSFIDEITKAEFSIRAAESTCQFPNN